MTRERKWDNNDRFWVTLSPFLFPEQRWQAAARSATQLAGLLGVKPGARFLDLGCGPGRYSLELARLGFRVTGVDRTRQYLAEARSRARGQSLSLVFVHSDMRRFLRRRAFEAVINMSSSFGYFEDPTDDLLVCRNALQSLRPGGAFLIETMSKETMARIFAPRSWRDVDGAFLLEERTVADDWSGLFQRWLLVRGGMVERFRVYMRLYSGAELGGLLMRAGFARVQLYGGLDGRPYNSEAGALVAVGRKRGGV